MKLYIEQKVEVEIVCVRYKILKIVFLISVPMIFSGCIVGSTLALPFKAAGSVINVVTPDIVGDSVSGVGEVVDTVVPF